MVRVVNPSEHAYSFWLCSNSVSTSIFILKLKGLKLKVEAGCC